MGRYATKSRPMIIINKPGSAFLILLFIMMSLLLYVGTVWRTTSYLVEISLQREKYEQRYLAAYALLQWSLALCKQEFDTIQQKTTTNPLVIPIKKWPPIESALYSGTIEFTQKNMDHLEVCVHLSDSSQNIVRSLSCTVERSINDLEQEDTNKKPTAHYRVYDWKIT